MKPIKRACIKKARNNRTAPFDKDFFASPLAEQIDDRLRIGTPIIQPNGFASHLFKRRYVCARKPQRAGRLP